MSNILSNFRFGSNKNNEDVFKSIMANDDLHVDEQGRHLIFRNIRGKVRPIRVGAEDFAEWLSNQNVDINPADQKTLRELDKELEIMERAAEYGGPKLQKQYEDYFNQRREQYAQLAQGYYQQALQNQAKKYNVAPEELQQSKQRSVEEERQEEGSLERREDLDARGWISALQLWIHGQDSAYNYTSDEDIWYYHRIYGVILSSLTESAKNGVPLSQIDMDEVFSTDFIKNAMEKYYGDFFAGEGGDPKTIVASIKTMQKFYYEDIRDNRKVMSNFVNYWYDRMQKDFAKEQEQYLKTSPSSPGVKEVPENVVPQELPNEITSTEGKALMGMYNRASGSKLGAAHRVMVHSLGRLIESIPLEERVSAAVDLADGSKGLHAVHKESYKRTFKDQNTLGITPDRDELLAQALDISTKAAKGSTKDKVSAMKRIAMIMGTMDGAATLASNPGIQEAQFTRKWHDTASNAGRVKSEGPGLLDIITDDEKRKANIFMNSDLKIMHAPQKEEEKPEEEKPAKKTTTSSRDIGDGYTFVGNKLYSPEGFVAEFEHTPHGYANVSVSTPSGKKAFDIKIYTPPVELSKLDPEDRKSYLDSVKLQVGGMIEQYRKFAGGTEMVSSEEEEDDEVSFADAEGGTFRVPIFDFGDVNLTQDDRDLLGEINQHVDELGLDVNQISPGIYRIVNPANQKTYDLIFNGKKKKLVGAVRNEEGKIVPFPDPNIEDFAAHMEVKTS